jgi:hypothetical protein
LFGCAAQKSWYAKQAQEHDLFAIDLFAVDAVMSVTSFPYVFELAGHSWGTMDSGHFPPFRRIFIVRSDFFLPIAENQCLAQE